MRRRDPSSDSAAATSDFCPGYGADPFRSLCAAYPCGDVYPPADFYTEWGPVFHRGRLDGSARVLVIGMVPTQLETVCKRILVGEGGGRLQGFLTKLGITRSYVMINSYLYAAARSQSLTRHERDTGVVAYRHAWLDALFTERIEAVIALGARADMSWHLWRATPHGAKADVPYVKITHPTQPESASKGDPARHKRAMASFLEDWNRALVQIAPAIRTPDTRVPPVPYGTTLRDDEWIPMPLADFPPGTPPWMTGRTLYATRTGDPYRGKKPGITIMVPGESRPGI